MNFLVEDTTAKTVNVWLIVAIVVAVALIIALIVVSTCYANLKKGVSFLYAVNSNEANINIESAISKNENAKKEMKEGVIKDYHKRHKDVSKHYDVEIKEVNKKFGEKMKEIKKEANKNIKEAKKAKDTAKAAAIREESQIEIDKVKISKQQALDPIVSEKTTELSKLENNFKPALTTYEKVRKLSKDSKPVSKLLEKSKTKGYVLPNYENK